MFVALGTAKVLFLDAMGKGCQYHVFDYLSCVRIRILFSACEHPPGGWATGFWPDPLPPGGVRQNPKSGLGAEGADLLSGKVAFGRPPPVCVRMGEWFFKSGQWPPPGVFKRSIVRMPLHWDLHSMLAAAHKAHAIKK